MAAIQVAAAIVELVSFSRECLDLYREARLNTNATHNELRLRLEVEAITFDRWCDAVGIKDMAKYADDNPETWRTGPEMEICSEQIQSTLGFRSPLVAELVLNVVKDLETKFEAARGRLPQETSRVATAPETISRRRFPWKRSSTNGLNQQVRAPKIPTQTHERFIRAGKFQLWDKKVFDRLLSDVSSINATLMKLVDNNVRDQISRRVEIESLGRRSKEEMFHEQAADHSDSDEIARLCQIKESIDENVIGTSAKATIRSAKAGLANECITRIPRFHISDFSGQKLTTQTARSASSLAGSDVLIEWRYHSSTKPPGFEQGLRLAALVTQLSRDRFQIPTCRGIAKDDENHRIGLVFNAPTAVQGVPWKDQDLHELIRSTKRHRPELSQRFELAKQLSIALLQFQTIHWLHKSLRSENIVCFKSQTASINTPVTSPQDQIRGDDQSTSHSRRPEQLPPFFLMGLDIARPDHASEFSESISQSRSGYRARNDSIELYGHPDLFVVNEKGSKPRYRAEYDIYSLGLVFLEIGLWRTLTDMRKESKKSNGTDFRHDIRTVYCDQLQFYMGEIYWRLTRRCIFGDFDRLDCPEGTEEWTSLQLAFEKQVVTELQRCQA